MSIDLEECCTYDWPFLLHMNWRGSGSMGRTSMVCLIWDVLVCIGEQRSGKVADPPWGHSWRGCWSLNVTVEGAHTGAILPDTLHATGLLAGLWQVRNRCWSWPTSQKKNILFHLSCGCPVNTSGKLTWTGAEVFCSILQTHKQMAYLLCEAL